MSKTYILYTMAFMLSNHKNASTAGPFDIAGLALSSGKLEYGIDMSNSGDVIIGDGLGVVESIGSIFMSSLINKVESITMRNAIMCLSPKSYPQVWIPYAVRQSTGAMKFDEMWPCAKIMYYIVRYNTHTGQFKIQHYAAKKDMLADFDKFNLEVANTNNDFTQANIRLKGNLPFNKADFHRVAQGIFRNKKKVSVENGIINYKNVKSMGKAGILMQTLINSKSKSLNGCTGSWENLLKIAKISHKVGPEITCIGSSVADFIGLWSCATGDISSITFANNGRIDQQSPFVSSGTMYTHCMICGQQGSPETHTTIKYRWDTVGAWA
jgi:hypothetical protein